MYSSGGRRIAAFPSRPPDVAACAGVVCVNAVLRDTAETDPQREDWQRRTTDVRRQTTDGSLSKAGESYRAGEACRARRCPLGRIATLSASFRARRRRKAVGNKTDGETAGHVARSVTQRPQHTKPLSAKRRNFHRMQCDTTTSGGDVGDRTPEQRAWVIAGTGTVKKRSNAEGRGAGTQGSVMRSTARCPRHPLGEGPKRTAPQQTRGWLALCWGRVGRWELRVRAGGGSFLCANCQ